MLAHLKAGVDRILGRHCPGRGMAILPDDIFLVSFPKSGNTWTRFLVANLRYPDEPATFANIYRLIPDIDGTQKRVFDAMSRPRIIKSHECFDTRYPRVIYIVRDPRDVALSLYHYDRKRRKVADDLPIDTFIPRFLAGNTGFYGSWGQNVASWLATRQDPSRLLLLRYEDMMTDTEQELGKIVKFLGWDAGPDRIAQAVERSSADRMRQLEQAGSDKSGLTRGSRKDIAFVRSARAGGWRADLPPSAVEKIEAAWGPLMKYLGYELSSPAASETREMGPLAILSGLSQ